MKPRPALARADRVRDRHRRRHRCIASLGRIGLRTLFYTVTVTCLAIGIGLLVVNALQSGRGMDPQMPEQAIAVGGQANAIAGAKPSLSVIDMMLGVVPRNVVKAAADGELLAVMFFALMHGHARERARRLGAATWICAGPALRQPQAPGGNGDLFRGS